MDPSIETIIFWLLNVFSYLLEVSRFITHCNLLSSGGSVMILAQPGVEHLMVRSNRFQVANWNMTSKIITLSTAFGFFLTFWVKCRRST